MSRSPSHSIHATGRERALGHLAMVGFALFVGSSFSLGARMVPFIDSAPLNAVRFALAAGIMAAVAFGMKRRRFAVPAMPWRFLLYGVLNGTYFITMFIALSMTAPVATSAVFTLTPLLTAGLAFLMLGQRVRPLVLVSILLAAGGAIWVIFEADIGAILAFDIGPGEAIFLVGCVAYALVSPLMRRLKQDEPGVVFTFWLLVGTAVCITVYGFSGLVGTDWLSLPPMVWWGLVYLAVFPTAVSFFLLQFASLRLPSSKVMAYVYAVPGFVIVIEGVAGRGWASGAIMAGVAVTVGALLILAFSPDV